MCGCRNFFTREENIEMLKDYKKCLENEINGITEKIKELERNN
jgi:hypothetical protein